MTQVLCPIVVGRDPELAVLEERLALTREGSGGLVFLVGEAGVGKSRLTREMEGRARELGMNVLRGRAVQAAAPIPFRPLAEALHTEVPTDSPPPAPELRPYRRALARLIPQWSTDAGAASPETPPLLVLEAALLLLRSLANPSGMLLVLEDIHWADEDTISAVEYLADHLDREPILCLATARSDEAGSGGALAETLSARRAAVRLVLPRLPDEEIDRMVRASLDEEAPRGILEAIRARAEGVPFLVEELLSAYVSAGRPSEDETWAKVVPPSYHDLVRSRLSAVSDDGRKVVFAAAVLGRSFDWSLLGAITGLDEEAVLVRLREAVGAQLVQTAGAAAQAAFGFRHALVREAVLRELLPPERAELSLRAAEVIEERFPGVPGEWCELAAELREAGGDALGAAKHLLEAGRRALARTALSAAETTLERGRALAGEDPWFQWGIGHVLLEVLALAGKFERVRDLGDALVPFVEQSTGARNFAQQILAPVHLRIARGVAAAAEWPLARSHLERAQRYARDEEGLRARIAAFAAHVALAEGDLEDAARGAETSLTTAERLDLPDVVCESLEVLGRTAFRRGGLPEARRSLARAVEVAGDRGLDSWRARALVALGTIDRCTNVDLGNLLEARSLTSATEAVSTRALIELEIGRTLASRFEREAAREALGESVEICRRYALPMLPHALGAQATALALLRRDGDAEALVEEAIDLAPDSADLLADLSAARATLGLVMGDRIRFEEELERGMDHLRRAPPGDPRPTPGLWALVRSLDGEEEARDEVSASGHSVHGAGTGYLSFAEAIALGRDGKREEAHERFERADRAIAPFPWDRHVGRLFAAEGAAQAGWGEPAAWMAESLAFFEAAGHRGLADACKRVLRGVGAPVPRKGRGDAEVPQALRALGVTSREMDVLALVAEGLSNPEIAGRLHLSRRTIESHVASLLRKTGAQTRQALAAVAERVD